MKVKLVLGIVCLALMLAVPGAQAATLLWNNGAPDSASGAEMASYLPADDFTFGSSQTVTNVRFWAVAAEGYGPPDLGVYNNSIVWQIYNNGSGQPGSLLNSGTATPTPVSSHATGWGQSYQFDFSITPTTLGPGAYWLALHNGPMTTQSNSNYS